MILLGQEMHFLKIRSKKVQSSHDMLRSSEVQTIPKGAQWKIRTLDVWLEWVALCTLHSRDDGQNATKYLML